MQVSIPYGEDRLKLGVEDRHLVTVAAPRQTRPISDLDTAVMRALERPQRSPSFRSFLGPGKKVALLIDNFARPTPEHSILPPILKAIRDARAEPSIIVANGGLRPTTEEELEAKLGKVILKSGIPVIQSVAKRKEDFVFLGVTSYGTPVEVNRAFLNADVRLGVHTTQMTLWGYGGGGSIVLPGVCSFQTIEWNHRLAISPRSIEPGYVGEENHLRNDIEEAAKLARIDMVLNAVLDVDGNVVDMAVGASRDSHMASIEKFDEIYSYPVNWTGKVDISISGSLRWDKYLAHSCWPISTLDPVTKDGGTIILATPSRGGLAHFSYIQDYLPATEENWRRLLGDIFNGKQELWHAILWYPIHCVLQKKKVIVVTGKDNVKSLKEIGIESTTSIDEAYDLALNRSPRDAKVLVAPYGKWMKPKRVGSKNSSR
jgi:nickel-dependent lactate racemase